MLLSQQAKLSKNKQYTKTTKMGFVQKLRDEVVMIRNITAYLEKEEAKEKARQEKATKKDVAVQATL
jgi:hypothetical protein